MVNLDINSDRVPADEYKDPVKIKPEDYEALRDIRAHVDALAKYRNEMGRLTQIVGNLREEANRIEGELANRRRALAEKYNLEQTGVRQWTVDFETKEFVRTAPGTPVIP